MTDDTRKPSWLWADAKSAAEWKKSYLANQAELLPHTVQNPSLRNENVTKLHGRALTAWAKERAESALEAHLLELDARLQPGATLTIEATDDELRLLIDGACVVELFDQPHTPFLAAQWRQFARTTNITEKYTGKKLLAALLKLRSTPDEHLRSSVVTLDSQIQSLDADIYKLYGLTDDEIRLVEGLQ